MLCSMKLAIRRRTSNSLWEISRIGTFIENRVEATKDWQDGQVGSYCLMGSEFLFGVMKILKTQ